MTEYRVTSHPEAGAALAIYIAGAVIGERSEEAGATQLELCHQAVPLFLDQTLAKGATKSDSW